MIYALFTMPLAMPLEKMAKGDEGAKSQAMSQYYAERGCVPGLFKFEKNYFYGAGTLDEIRAMVPAFMTERPGTDATTIFIFSSPGITGDADTVQQYNHIMRFKGDQVVPWDDVSSIPMHQSSGMSCPIEYATSDQTDDAITVHGDPMFQHDGKGQHFWLKEGVLSPLLDWTSDDGHKMSLQGLTVANAETGHQWFKQIALVRDGKQVFDAKAGFGTKPVLTMSGSDDGLLGLAPSNTTAVVDASTKFVGSKANRKAVQVIKAGGMTFELTAESAHKFADAMQQTKYAHVNVKMPEGLAKDATGLFAELAGAQPMSGATKALLRSPK